MIDNMSNAYTEVIELLKFFPKESIDKIPDEKLELYYMNRNKDYEYKVDTTKAFKDQKMLKETKAIFAIIFRDYWATDYQRERILAKQAYDRKIREEELMRKYSPDNIFKKNN